MEPPDVLGASEARYKLRRKKDEDENGQKDTKGEFYKVGIGSNGRTDALTLCVPCHIACILLYIVSNLIGRSRSWQPFFGACRTSRKSQE